MSSSNTDRDEPWERSDAKMVEEFLDAYDQQELLPGVSKTPAHFQHAQEVVNEIKRLCKIPILGSCQYDGRQVYQMKMSLVGKIAGYQEKAHLLDPFMEQMVEPLITTIRDAIYSVTVGDHKGEKLNVMGDAVFFMLNFVTKTRGYKTVVKFFPHEVADLEPSFQFFELLCVDRRRGAWENRYMMLVWLSLMCMIPFDLKSIDSQATADSVRLPLVERMLKATKPLMDTAGKDRDGAALFLARLLTRKDTCDTYLPEFVDWCTVTMTAQGEQGGLPKPTIFQALGIMTTLCWILKLGQRDVLLPIVDQLEPLLAHVESNDSFLSVAATKKLVVKLSQRVALCLLKPRVAAWRYQRGNRSLVSNLGGGAGGAMDKDNVNMAITVQDEGDDDDFDVPESIENTIERLMNGLRDRDTIVRWSAAKGLGRISNRLPKDLADDVVGGVFELFSEDVFTLPNGQQDLTSVSEFTWHGACLAVAELSRRGLLLPHRLSELIPWIILALKFDVKRGAHSVGSNVRDASCYVCWSFARAYTPEILAPHVDQLSKTLVAASVFDREISIRRASSAAFQENVGRMGIFAHGIDIVTVADYFSVGNLSNAFLVVAPQIAAFEEYREFLADHLLNVTVQHWDIGIRELAAEVMAKIAVLDLNHSCKVVVPRLVEMTKSLDHQIRHGALIALGRTCNAICEHLRVSDPTANNNARTISNLIDEALLESIGQVVGSVPEYALSGFGSEHVLQALCVHISCLSDAAWPAKPEVLEIWRKIVRLTLERVEEPLQRLAADTFRAMVAQYGISDQDFGACLERIQPGAEKLGQRGYALALGEIQYDKVVVYGSQGSLSPPSWVLKAVHALAINASVEAIVPSTSGPATVVPNYNAEARRNSVLAVTNIVQNLGSSGSYKKYIPAQVSSDILEIYFKGLEDYSVDHRGDVGSWVREASMKGLQVMVPLVSELDLEQQQLEGESVGYLSDDQHAKVLGKLLQQSVQKIDRIRACAAEAILVVLYAQSKVVQEKKERQKAEKEKKAQKEQLMDEEEDFDPDKSMEVDLNPLDLRDVEEKDTDSDYLLRVPFRRDLMAVLKKDEYLNWLQASEVYPQMVPLLHIPTYRTELLTGLVISAGGLTETLVRYSSTSLLEFVSDLPVAAEDNDAEEGARTDGYGLTLVGFGQALLALIDKYEGQDRVIIPLLEVLDLLLESGTLLMMDHPTVFDFAPLVRFVRRQTIRCKDTRKLTACIRVYCGLCSGISGKIRKAILGELLKLLGHAFPKIRRATADGMYLMLTNLVLDDDEDDDQQEEGADTGVAKLTEENLEKATALLSTTDWNLAVPRLVAARNQLYPLLAVEVPKPAPAVRK